jgi:hypothetical protein
VEAKLIGWPATWLGHPATTRQVTASAKSVELSHGPINIPPTIGNQNTHHILEIPLAKRSVLVARHSLVGRVARL